MPQTLENITPERCAELAVYATESQARYLAAIAAAGSFGGAANALKVDRNTVKGAFKAAKVRAARRGFAPEHGWQAPAVARSEPIGTVPGGFKVKGVSDLVDDDGKRKQAWIKSTESPIENAHPALPAGFIPREISEGKDAQGNIFARWTRYKPEEAERFAAIEEAVRASAAGFVRPLEPVAPPENTDADTMAIYPIGDMHIGMLAHREESGEDCDLKIVEQDLCRAMDRMVERMPRCRVGVLLPMGDNFHADDSAQVTPKGRHKLSVDTRPHRVARVGVNALRYMVDRALTIHEEVEVRILDGNHDPISSMWLRLCLEGWYAHEPRVKVMSDVSALQVWEFGLNMLAACHGDAITPEQMPLIMAARYAEIWGRTVYRYGYQGHRHKRMIIEKPGALIEVVRTLISADDFAARYGHDSGRSLQGIVIHKLFGELYRITSDIALVRASGV